MDKWRQYLIQQAELGGDEIYLAEAGPTGRRAGGQEAETVQPDVTQTSGSTARQPVGPSDVAWQKGAPPIPGPGLTIELPDLDLLGDGLGSLDSLDAVAERIASCTRCGLSKSRNLTVPGEGDPNADLMLVGEGPGAKEDETGRPFIGAAGTLLTQILGSIGISREDVFIANVVKCRPPQNRKPLPDESAACLPYLRRQVQLVRPKVILALGATAAEALLGARQTLGQMRGAVHSYGGVPLVVTYHPAALLRNPNWKKPTWDDVRIARQLLDR